ncbi:MAG: hypothetical protein K8R53_03535, partial [Bacteroidales bacterium]|nr:hypothetical protein [Bacteroidales bacterium]
MRNLYRIAICITICTLFIGFFRGYSQGTGNKTASSISLNDIILTIHLRGVYESKISLLPMTGEKALQPVIVNEGVKNNSESIMQIPAEYLPGEFVLRFDYKEDASSTPYPSEKRMVIGEQDIELWVHPMFANNPDSTWYQEDEKENTAFER